ncbi:MAG: autotransporter outer membrane beta-barrel domain-containing protein [Selenomonas sp.]|nr:autotransporter outer membrane beta-barrel domain-containing protein [Selenomonas sp.]
MRKQGHYSRRLAALITGALLFSGGGTANLPIAAAQSTTISGDTNPGAGNNAYGNNGGVNFNAYDNANTANNSITLTNGTVKGIYGAYAINGTTNSSLSYGLINNVLTPYLNSTISIPGITNNTVTISGGSVTENVFGGYTISTIFYRYNTQSVPQYARGVISPTGITGNTVNISGGTVGGAVYGGYLAEDIETAPAWASNMDSANPVSSSTAPVNNNIVNISGGTINGKVIGGYNESSGEASGNIVNISGGTINGYVTGGLSMNGNANNNTVNILTAITLAGINGGTTFGSGTTDGNTINIAAKGVTVTDNIYDAQNLNFYLPSDIEANDTMLTINGGATDLTGVTIGAAAQTGVSLNQGDTVNLISNSAGFTGTAATTTLTTAPTATSLTLDTSYKFAINQGDTAITATVTDKTESSTESSMERAKSLVETRAATTTFINAGADMLSSQGFMQAANAVALEAAEQTTSGAAGVPSVSTFTPFAAMGGSSMRAQSGSYVDTKGFGLNVGFAREINNAQGKLLFGPVVEYGGGNYDSYLEDAAGTHGEGGAHYYGLGIMARQVNHDGLYYEGSLRGGRVNSDYKTTMDTLGKVDYDSSSNYFAAHLGVGKAFNIGNGNTLDGYLKYFYSHQAGDTTTIHIENAADERGSFDAVDSHRLRIGARLTHKVNDRNSFYGGLAYQYEFGGEARAHFSSGGNVPSPSVKGGSGMLELGWQVKPGETPLTLDLGLTGWAGKQRGGSVQLGATWKF